MGEPWNERDPDEGRLLFRPPLPQVPLLRVHAPGRVPSLGDLQPYVHSELLRRSHRGVSKSHRGRDAVGCQRRADRRDFRARRLRVHQPADAPRPHQMRRRSVQVRADHRRGRRHCQRAGPAAGGRGPVVAGALGLRCRAVGARLRGGKRARCEGARARNLPGAGSGPQSRRCDGRFVRRCGDEDPLLLDPADRSGGHTGGDQPDRLERRARLRNLSPRPGAGRTAVGPDHGGGRSPTASGRSRRRRSAASRPGYSATAPI